MPKLGSHEKPAVVRVHTQQKAEEIVALCNERGWQVIVGIEPDKPEDISDLKKIMKKKKRLKKTKPV